MNLNPNEVKVLAALSSVGDVDENYLTFRGVMDRVRLKRPDVRRACRSLARKGLAKFGKGLWTEDGAPFGSGYAATSAGREMADQTLADKIADRMWA